MNADVLDLVLVGAVALFAWSGYRQGFLVGVLSFAGFLGGGVLGTLLSPLFAEQFAQGDARVFIGIGTVLVLATVGQLIGTALGGTLRSRLTWKPARLIDAIAGSVTSAIGVLLVAWLLGTAVVSSPFTGLAEQVRGSVVLRTVDDVMPPVPRLFASFRGLLDRQGFPQVFEGLQLRDPRPVPPPDPAVLNSTAVRNSRSRILKITGVAPSCSRRLEGTGFVYAPQRVMTNAHVVAGVRSPKVEVEGSQRSATVVLFDPGRDVAVLFVPSLELAPLAFSGTAQRGDQAVVAGYPQDGPFSAVAARVREKITADGRDIYQERPARREVYSIFARVLPGNSGGPLLAPDGRVYGVIFAADAEQRDTGYALTASEVASDARAGATRTTPVSTRGCD